MWNKPKYTPDEIFTPRAATVNEFMYVDRSELEKSLKKQAVGTRHLILHGESGNGKTWLYKKVFADMEIPYLVVNLANASRLGTVQEAFKDKISKNSSDQKLSQIVSQKTAGAKAVLEVEYSDQKIIEIVEREPLEALMALLFREAEGKKSLLVLDNFEQIVGNASLVKELSDAMILLDDEDYAKFNVRFCIVGVPSDIREYLAKHSAIETVTNRVVEIPEVARLTQAEAKALVSRGFDALSVDADPEIVDQIVWKTDRIAQHLHELGLECAQAPFSVDKKLTNNLLETAVNSWVDASLTAVREVIDSHLNARDTKAGRRNQVIFALGCLKIEDFKYTDVEEKVREQFPESTDGIALNVTQTLSALAKGEHPIIKRVPKGDAYRFINPKVKIGIRVLMHRTPSGKAEKVRVQT